MTDTNPIDKISEETQAAFRELLTRCEQEDLFIRYAQVRTWKKAEEFWHGIQFIFWSEIAHEWRTPENLAESSDETRDNAGPFYDYVINIYKAHGESIIAALTPEIPVVEFLPDDADVPEDLSTAKTKTKIALLIQKHNKSKLLLMEALHKLYNAGLVASYIYPKADNDYGTRQIPKYDKQSFDVNYEDCPICSMRLGEHNPMMGQMQAETRICPTCGSEAVPNINTEVEERLVQTGTEDVPKSRTCIEIFGPLNVKIPYYIRTQKEAGYLIHYIEQHFGLVRNTYPYIRDKIRPEYSVGDTDRWTRTPSSFASAPRGVDNVTNLVTVKKLWLRTWMFDSLEDKVQAEELKKEYPNGVKIVFVNQEIAEVIKENMDDLWEIGKAGPSTFIHSDGLGSSVIPIQELRNNTVNLTVETIEHGIPTGFADPSVLNFDEYSATEVLPGSIYPAKAPPGHKLDEYFYEQKTATLSKEVEPFLSKLDQDAQFVLGSFPSIYGGPTAASSRTAAEYNMSRQNALQRLSIAWEYVRVWWLGTIKKAVQCFIVNMVDDEQYVKKEADLYSNIIIRRTDLIGKATTEPEASEHFPISSMQKKQVLIELMQMQNEAVQETIIHPENIKIISQILGFPELYLPGEDQRFKQLVEIYSMIRSGEEVPLPIELEIDDDESHIQTCKIFLASERGQDLKVVNPIAYMSIKAHSKLHEDALKLKTLEQNATPMGVAPDAAIAGTGV